MGLLTNLFKLIGPTLPQGFCPTSFQELSDTQFNGAQITFLIDTGTFLYNYGTATPAPENRIFPWLNTDDAKWWTFKFGMWVSPVAPRDLVDGFRQMYLPVGGTLESVVWALDSGDGLDPAITPPNLDGTSGAMWSVDHTMDGRFPLAAGIIPNSDLGSGSASVGINQTGDSFGREGEYAHLLTEAEGAVGQHVHAFGQYNGTTGAAGFNGQALPLVTVEAYDTVFVAGGGPFSALGVTQANMFTSKTNLGAGVVADKFNVMPGYRSVWWLKHTSRRYYTRPA